MSYDPFTRGAAPVGVRTVNVADDSRGGRALTVEIWYPATERYRGQDLEGATRDRFTFAPELPAYTQSAVRDADAAHGRYPLLLHSHGAFGHRRVMSTLCTHLASHGYIVASNDVPGNTSDVLMNDVIAQRRGEPPTAPSQQSVNRHRWRDASFVIDAVIAGADPELATRIDATRIGALGQSSGGWTSLGLNSIDRRIGATFAMEPLYGTRSPFPAMAEMAAWLRVDNWKRPVPTFLLAGEKDALIILEDLRELYEALPAPKRFANLIGAGHFHFTDNAEEWHDTFRKMFLASFPDSSFDSHALGVAMRPWAEFCSAEQAADTMRSLCLAHMDAYLKAEPAALAFLDDDLAATLAGRGIDIEIGTPVLDAELTAAG